MKQRILHLHSKYILIGIYKEYKYETVLQVRYNKVYKYEYDTHVYRAINLELIIAVVNYSINHAPGACVNMNILMHRDILCMCPVAALFSHAPKYSRNKGARGKKVVAGIYELV